MFSADQLALWVAPRALRRGSMPAMITGVSIDSRRVQPGELYVAIRGERFDGHDFIDQAIANGAAAVLVDHDGDWPVGVVQVDETRAALGRLAHGWRAQFGMTVIAVTGSNGKTTVKEMIAAIGRAAFGQTAVHATAGNMNNDIGVPLTLLAMRASHRLAVVELGTNHPGEIAALAALTCPQVALVTNAQREHQEFLAGVEGSARENGSVFRRCRPTAPRYSRWTMPARRYGRRCAGTERYAASPSMADRQRRPAVRRGCTEPRSPVGWTWSSTAAAHLSSSRSRVCTMCATRSPPPPAPALPALPSRRSFAGLRLSVRWPAAWCPVAPRPAPS
ncbi:MAG: Mur ligase family protein [Burkholderiaceae bacterium]